MDGARGKPRDAWFSITLSPGAVLKLLLAAIVLLLLCGFAVNYYRYVLNGAHREFLYAMFNVDWERNVPSACSALGLLLSSLLLLSLGRMARTDGGPWRAHYLSLGLLFLLLACDELLGFHERLSAALVSYLDTDSLFTLGSVLLAMLILPPLAALVWRWLFALPRGIMRMMTLSAIVFLAGAVGVELVSIGYAQAQGTKANLTYQMLALLEEALEMIGVALFNYALIALIVRRRRQIVLRGARLLQVTFGSSGAEGPRGPGLARVPGNRLDAGSRDPVADMES